MFSSFSVEELIATPLFSDRFEQILLEQDPAPSYGLRLLWALLDQNPSFIKQCQSLGLIPVIFQVIHVSTFILVLLKHSQTFHVWHVLLHL